MYLSNNILTIELFLLKNVYRKTKNIILEAIHILLGAQNLKFYDANDSVYSLYMYLWTVSIPETG